MTKPAQVASLADFAYDELGSIDLWCVLNPALLCPVLPCPALPCPALPCTANVLLPLLFNAS